MKSFRNIFFWLCLLFGLDADGYSQTGVSVSATGQVIAEVIPVFSATETSQLNFGRFSPGPQGGEIILTPESAISVLGNVRAAPGLHNAASFYLSGDPNASFTVSLPREPVVLRHVSTAKTMIIDDWVSLPGTAAGAGILVNGEQTVLIGATLKVGSIEDNPVGIYSGSYIVTFDFN
jgi:hypothetical protein